jgi:hypothetical protein
MGTRWRADQVDLWCAEWAVVRRQVLGIQLDERLEPRDRLGKLRCTLGALLEDKVGAGERTTRIGLNGHPDQNWPEVYTNNAREIQLAFERMRYEWRAILDAHYAWSMIPPKLKIEAMNISDDMYWKRLGFAKIFIAGFLRLDPETMTKCRKGKDFHYKQNANSGPHKNKKSAAAINIKTNAEKALPSYAESA